jgi:SNF2 family DNA or RNA helicase
MKVRIESNAIYVSEEHNFDGTWNASRRMWKLPNNIGVLEEVNRVSPSKELAKIITDRKMARRKLISKKKLKDTEGLAQLRPYQRVDVAYLKNIRHVGIFSEMRTGKTPISIQLFQEGLNIVICPASIVFNWEGEIEKWLPTAETYPVSGAKKKRIKIYETSIKEDSEVGVSVLIMGYETLRQDLHILLPLLKATSLTVMADEAHRICNHKSGISQAAQAIAKLAQKRVAITGTPVRNKGQDIFGILAFLYPDRYTGFWQFADRYFEVDKEGDYMKVGDYKREKELTDIVDLFSVNRKRREVMAWLPKKQYIEVKLEMGKDQEKVYKSVLDTFVYEEDGEVKVDASGILPQLTRLRQITLAPEMLDIKASSTKEKYVLDWLQDNHKEQVIIFSSFSSYLRILKDKLKKESVDIIDGTVPKAKRMEIVKRFQAGNLRVLLANIIAGGVGLTLDNAEHIIFLDKDYTPIHNDQAEDRIIPVTEDRNHSCTIISLIAKGTVDEKVEYVLKQKHKVIDVINEIGFKNFLK